MYKKAFLISYQKDQGILFADTLAQAHELKRFLRCRGEITEIQSAHGTEFIRVVGYYKMIAEAHNLVKRLTRVNPWLA